MKYLLTGLIVIALSCKKSDNNARQETAKPEVKSVAWATYYSSPSIPNIRWSISLIVPDSNVITKLTLNRVTPAYVAIEITNPVSKSYSLTQPGYKCPSYNDNAYFYFEWTKKDGTKEKLDPFQVWE